MKLIIFFLSVCFVGMVSLPCKDFCKDKTHCESNKECNDDNESHNECQPFCNCMCCSLVVFQQLLSLEIYVPYKVKNFSINFDKKSFSNFSANIWQPPKIA